jgi:hypothetical protein
MPRAIHGALTVLLLGAVVAATGCGSSSSGDQPPQPEPTGVPQDFPAAKGKTMAQLRAEHPEALVFAPGQSSVDAGTNRYVFQILDRAAKQVPGAKVALYTSKPDGSGLRGPFVADAVKFGLKPAFRSQTTAADPAIQAGFYVGRLRFPRKGKQVVMALVQLDGRLVSTSRFGLDVGAETGVPKVGDKAIRIHTQTLAQVGGDAKKLSTRVPPAKDLIDTDFATVVGRKPVVLMFATPALCQSRVCGPVVDVEEQVKSGAGDRVAFIHQEIYANNNPRQGLRPQVDAWHLQTEPWTFVIGRDGRIKTRFEGALSVGELKAAVDKVR